MTGWLASWFNVMHAYWFMLREHALRLNQQASMSAQKSSLESVKLAAFDT